MSTSLTVNKANIFKRTYKLSKKDGQLLGSLTLKGFLNLSAVAESDYLKWKFNRTSFLSKDVCITGFDTHELIAKFNFVNSSGEAFTDHDIKATKFSIDGALMMGGEKYMLLSSGYLRPEYIWVTSLNEKIIKYKSRGFFSSSTDLTVDDTVFSKKQSRLLILFGLYLIKLIDSDNASSGG